MSALSTTTLSRAVTAGTSEWSLAAVTAITSALDASGQCQLFCDGELVTVTARPVGLSAMVQRGVGGSTNSSHASGATVYIGQPGEFYASDPVGVASSPPTTPWINVVDNRVWTVSNNTWILATSNESAASPTITGTVGGSASYSTPTLTSPVITAPSGSGSTGLLITKSGVLTELTGTATYSVTIPVPAGALIQSIRVVPQALWTAATSAELIVGDTADPDGYFTTTNLKATDLVVGEVLDTVNSGLWGGVEGAYLVAATGQRGPTTDNFGPYYVAGSNIVFAAAKVGAGTAGRTLCSVTYSIGETIAQVVTA